MSSHHIVREKQEPALLIAGLDNFDDELLGQLLEWSPTVVVTNTTAEKVQAYGIKIDWLVANEMMDLQQANTKLIKPGSADAITAALDQLIIQGYHAVNLITDNFEPGNYVQFFELTALVVFYQRKKIIAVHSGFNKWMPAGERIEILTVPHNFVYTGLLGLTDTVYETTDNGLLSLQFTNTYLLIAEQL